MRPWEADERDSGAGGGGDNVDCGNDGRVGGWGSNREAGEEAAAMEVDNNG